MANSKTKMQEIKKISKVVITFEDGTTYEPERCGVLEAHYGKGKQPEGSLFLKDNLDSNEAIILLDTVYNWGINVFGENIWEAIKKIENADNINN